MTCPHGESKKSNMTYKKDEKDTEKDTKYVAVCFKCKEYELVVDSEDAKCPYCGGDVKIVGTKLNIMTSNGVFRKHL